MIPTGLMYSTDHARALLDSYVHLAKHVDLSAETMLAAADVLDASDDFGEALWAMPTPGWDVQDVLSNVKGRHDTLKAAMQRLSDLLAAEGG